MSTTIAIVLVLLAAGLFAYAKHRQHRTHVTTGDSIGLAWLMLASGVLAIIGLAVGVFA